MNNKLLHYIIFLIILDLTISCSSESQLIPVSLSIDNEDSREFILDDLFKEWKFIKVNSLINKVDDILETDDRIFLLDRSMEFVKVIDSEGRQISTIQGDILQNGNFIQPVCLSINNEGEVFFYDAANQAFFFIDKNGELLNTQDADFYCNRIYRYRDGFLVFKNQSTQNQEDTTFQYNILTTDNHFKVRDKYFPFVIIQNVQRVWNYFPDPVSISDEGFNYFLPLTPHYFHVDSASNITQIPINFRKQGLTNQILKSVNLDNPQDVFQKILNNYALINNKQLLGSTISGLRFLMNGRAKFQMNYLDSSSLIVDKLFINYENQQLLIPFPSAQYQNKWYSILDSENYSILNLDSYDHLHPIIDSVLAGSTYIISIKTDK